MFFIGRYYCSRSCQTTDWKTHKQHHKTLASVKDSADCLKLDAPSLPLQEVCAVERDSKGKDLLLKASVGDWRAVKRLLLEGANATIADDQGFTALDITSYFGHVNAARILIENGPAGLVLHTTTTGVSCLFVASQNGHLDTTKLLVRAGGDALLLRTNESGISCLNVASENGHLDIVKYLTQAGGKALFLKTAVDGGSCLHGASENGHLAVVKHLTKVGGEALLLLKTSNRHFSCPHTSHLSTATWRLWSI